MVYRNNFLQNYKNISLEKLVKIIPFNNIKKIIQPTILYYSQEEKLTNK